MEKRTRTEENDPLLTLPLLSLQVEIEGKKEEKALKDFFPGGKPGHCLHMHGMGDK